MNKPEGYPKISVVICCLNEEENLPHVLPKIPQWVDEILLIDGHSADNTVEVATKLRPEIKVLYQEGSGKGDALRHGVQNATGDIVVTIDADGATNPEEIPSFIEPLLNGYTFTKGSRFNSRRPADMPLRRWVGNKIIVNTCNILFGTSYTDLCSGYSAFWRAHMLKIDPWADDNWGYEPLITVRALKAGFKIREVTYGHKGRIEGQSKLPDWRQGFNAVKTLVRERFNA